jgi:hypothetical protein
VKAFILIVAVLIAIAPAAARDGVTRPARWYRPEYVPPRRPAPPPPAIAIPQQFSPPQETYASFPASPATAGGAAPAATEPSPCQLRLGKLATFKPLPVLVGPGECGAADAVRLESVTLPDDTKVALSPPATLRCTMAEQMALWLREDVGPATASLGAQMRVLEDYDSYECRGQNRVRGATLSEHGRANALDLRGFKLANGRTVELTDVNVDKEWRERLRVSGCARFHTVLGPGSDGNHETHIHVDLAERRSGYKICQWDIREPAKVAEKAKPESEERAKGNGEEKTKAAGEEKTKAELDKKTKPETEEKAKPGTEQKVKAEPEQKAKAAANERAKPEPEQKAKPGFVDKTKPEVAGKTKLEAEEKTKPEADKKAAAVQEPVPLPSSRPSAGAADKSSLPPTATAADQPRAPLAANNAPQRHVKRRRWRYYRWWW